MKLDDLQGWIRAHRIISRDTFVVRQGATS
jgi:hypothetical protein